MFFNISHVLLEHVIVFLSCDCVKKVQGFYNGLTNAAFFTGSFKRDFVFSAHYGQHHHYFYPSDVYCTGKTADSCEDCQGISE
jgi:hypothetical protein